MEKKGVSCENVSMEMCLGMFMCCMMALVKSDVRTDAEEEPQ